MSTPDIWTIEKLLAQRDVLPDGGRWTELVAGKIVTLSPPTIEHGTTVLNLSKALAEFSQREKTGYACFELGLVVARNPDTVRFPAVSFFAEGPMFAEADKFLTEVRPSLVVDVASTNDRRRGMDLRVSAWLDWGVRYVWVLDPHGKEAYAFEKSRQSQQLADHQTLFGSGPLSAFKINVGELFKEPAWYK
jgi:Uma2 family endonuclease